MTSLDSSSVAFKLIQRGRNFKLVVYVSTTKSRGTLLHPRGTWNISRDSMTATLTLLAASLSLAAEPGLRVGSFFGRTSGAVLPRPPPGSLSPPSHFDPLEPGPYFLGASRTDSISGEPRDVQIERLSIRPACFQLHGFLSDAECDEIIRAADAQTMEAATTAGGDPRIGCDVAWLKLDEHRVAQAVASDCASWLLRAEAVAWGRGSGFENLQVLRYRRGGEFKLHHDANEVHARMLTVLMYLNEPEVAYVATWFPLARSDEHAKDAPNPPSREAALKAAASLSPERGDGLLVRPSKGDCVAFYNFLDEAPGLTLDRLAMHAGLPAPGEKSVAALWFHLGTPFVR